LEDTRNDRKKTQTLLENEHHVAFFAEIENLAMKLYRECFRVPVSDHDEVVPEGELG
jgi:hypothetical protein